VIYHNYDRQLGYVVLRIHKIHKRLRHFTFMQLYILIQSKTCP